MIFKRDISYIPFFLDNRDMARAQTIGQYLLFKNLPQEIKEEYLGKN